MINNKKAAMFGLCRMLRKQSGRLFLVSSQSVDSQETRVEHQFKRAAMFGLDARIALAIFGALSIISGAALYSAIQSAKVTARIAILSEIDKAIIARYLDVGTHLVKFNFSTLNLEGLFVDNLEKGWKGPYLSKYTSLGAPSMVGSEASGVFNDKATILLKKANNTNWDDYSEAGAACTVTDCNLWIEMRYANLTDISLSFFKQIDIAVDGVNSATTGNIRYGTGTDDSYYNLFYKSMSLI